MKQLLITLTVVLVCATGMAHEGHDHDAPKGITAPKGGVIKGLEQTLIEVVNKGKDLKIYIYDTELKPLDAAQFKITAIAQKPRVKKQDEVKLTAAGNMLEATYDAQGVHRYTLILSVKDPKEDHADKIKFVIEPK